MTPLRPERPTRASQARKKGELELFLDQNHEKVPLGKMKRSPEVKAIHLSSRPE
jgi:hypothetical protein